MNSTLTINNTVRFFVLLLVQVLILKNIQVSTYLNLFIYPMFILLLPVRTPRWAIIIASFFLGLMVDVFYDSLGVHAAVATFMAYARDWVLRLLEPRGGYTSDRTPNRKMLGDAWFLQYSALFLFFYVLVYCVAEIFSVSINLDFILRLLITYLFSYICILLPQYLFPVAR
jgi:hypothetical protein